MRYINQLYTFGKSNSKVLFLNLSTHEIPEATTRSASYVTQNAE